MKKNNINRFIIFSLYLYLSGFLSLYAISADVDVEYSESPVIICRIGDEDSPRLLESLKNGYKSQIEIEILLYKERKSPYSVFGDILIEKVETSRAAEKDFFSDLLIIKDIENKTFYNKTDVFLNDYFSYKIPVPSELINLEEIDNYYLKIRASLVYRLYIRPFNIFYLLKHKDRSSTDWIIRKLIQVKE